MSLRIYGNRALKTLSGKATRPTSARVRQAVFNIWQGTIAGCHWLDLCAGSGAMGAEALCRGAQTVVGIEQSARACDIIRHNWQQVVQANQTFEVIQGDVVKHLQTLAGRSFDRIYFDPPYTSNLYVPVLNTIVQHCLLAPDGELAVEHSTQQSSFFPTPAELECHRQKTYGSTSVSFYIWTNEIANTLTS